MIAAVLALRLVRVPGQRLAWGLIAAGLALMALRRIVSIGFGEPVAGLTAELIALGISIVVLAGVAMMGPVLRLSRASGEALRARDRRFRRMIEQSTDVFVLVNPAGVIEFASPSIERVLGAPPETFVGQSIFTITAPDDVDEVRHNFATLLEQPGGSVHVEVRGRHADGGFRWLDAVGMNLLNDPAVGAIVGTFHDVTQRRSVEDRLRRREQELQTLADNARASEASYRALVDHATYGIYRSSPEGRFLSANPAMVRLLGYESEAQLKTVDVARDVYRTPEVRERLIAQYRHVERIDNLEVEWKRRDGSPILVRLSGRPIYDDAGRLVCFEMLAEDVTERRALEAQLRQAQKMEAVGQLTGGIAHDFNNLLTVILANADILARGIAGGRPDLLEDVAELRRAAQRGSDMIRKLLGFSRREVLVLKPLVLSEVVAEILPVLRRVMPEHIDVRFAARDRDQTVRADQGALEQILINLATNARDAMAHGGRIRIDVVPLELDRDDQVLQGFGHEGAYVRLTFADNGEGMSEATMERMFDPFFTTKPPGVGTGLGMAMIYGLVKQQQGYIDVTSALGKGTKVHLYFPVADEAATATQHSATPAVVRHEGTETILVVEDEPAIRRAAKRLLEKKGYTVLLAEDGVAALDVIERQGDRIQLVISDVVMPRMGGAQLFEALRSRRWERPFLFTSGYTVRDVRAATVLDTSVPFVHKPWDVNEFLTRVREALDTL